MGFLTSLVAKIQAEKVFPEATWESDDDDTPVIGRIGPFIIEVVAMQGQYKGKWKIEVQYNKLSGKRTTLHLSPMFDELEPGIQATREMLLNHTQHMTELFNGASPAPPRPASEITPERLLDALLKKPVLFVGFLGLLKAKPPLIQWSVGPVEIIRYDDDMKPMVKIREAGDAWFVTYTSPHDHGVKKKARLFPTLDEAKAGADEHMGKWFTVLG